MPFRITPHSIALVFMVAGVLSVVLNEPLARLDNLLIKGGPCRMEQGRMRTARMMVIGVGFLLVILACVLVATD
jgi:hypothetical protein